MKLDIDTIRHPGVVALATAFLILGVFMMLVSINCSSDSTDSVQQRQTHNFTTLEDPAPQQPLGTNQFVDPGFHLVFSDQALPLNSTPLQVCQWAIAVDAGLKDSQVEHSSVHTDDTNNSRDWIMNEVRLFAPSDSVQAKHKTIYSYIWAGNLEQVKDEVVFSDGTYVLHTRNGFTNPNYDNVGHNMRILRSDGTATIANYGYAGGDSCVVSEWSRWEGPIPQHDLNWLDQTSETMHFPDGVAVRVEMVPDYTRTSLEVAMGGLYVDWGINLKSATVIRPDGVSTDIPIPDQGADVSVDLDNGVSVHIRAPGFHVAMYAYAQE